ncbi:TATA box-binding protein-associated factor RNA polymerase I subunit B [Belonocnema kinseyi]|uniref:TATA box-binding protein-associated factor RNA polymerase I subunit B n=1 Tax=Belonocnema kinseyi TaxID=2817044 RepID=UPI00143CD868|nr:TATA box-binding protein-associated factor RNA polymerase I subunit B [Belonocnema kinseyi]
MANAQTCEVCRGTSFEIIDGNFFCIKCFTQNDNIQENVRERFDASTRIRFLGKMKQKSDKPVEIDGWTSWELYNFILHGITNEAIELGASSAIKLTVLQLWATYLGRIEVAFTSTKKKCVPKLARKFHRRDAEIIYGRIKQSKKRKRRRGSTSASSMISSFQSAGSVSSRSSKKNIEKLLVAEYDKASSANDSLSSFSANQSLVSLQSSFSQGSSTRTRMMFNKGAIEEKKKVKELSKKVSYSERRRYKKHHITTQYKQGPQVITPMKLWVILYLALRIHGQNIHLSDMLRYGREGHLSYYKLDNLLPPEVSITKKDIKMLSQSTEMTHKGFRKVAAGVAQFLDVQLDLPDFSTLIEQYCQELQLPRGILLYAEKLMALSPPNMIFDYKSSCTPNYEGRAMAFIVVVLKILFGMDGITEYEISRVAEKINREASERGVLLSRLFSFREWQRFIECRRSILSNVHFPTKLRYDPESPGNTHLYLRFLGLMQSKKEGEPPRITDYKHRIPELLSSGFQSCFDALNENIPPVDEITIFPPSLTPQFSYIQHLMTDPLNDLPDILRVNFFDTKVGYTTKPELLQELAAQCDIELTLADTSLHFIGKKVSEFEQSRIPSVQSLSEKVIIQYPDENTNVKSENPFDYLHRKTASEITVDKNKKKYYDNVKFETSESPEFSFYDEFLFDQVGENGKLLLPVDSGSGNENLAASVGKIDLAPLEKDSLLKEQFCKTYNLSLSKREQKAAMQPDVVLSKRRHVQKTFSRNDQGKFVRNSKRKSRCQEHKYLEGYVKCESEQESVVSVSEDEDVDENPIDAEIETKIFRPFKDYWMYNCIFSRVKPKNFELFEKELPVSFRWLLRECADVTEMSTEDLYEEICLVEAYYSHIFKPENEKKKRKNSINTAYRNTILKKW